MLRLVISVLIPVVLCGCGWKGAVIDHDEAMAAQKAKEFAEVAFIKRNYQVAFGLLSAETRKHVSLSDTERVVKEMHGQSFPDTVMAGSVHLTV
jgi:Tfp pilus assembly protein PilO